jgi:hypothetical protein
MLELDTEIRRVTFSTLCAGWERFSHSINVFCAQEAREALIPPLKQVVTNNAG